MRWFTRPWRKQRPTTFWLFWICGLVFSVAACSTPLPPAPPTDLLGARAATDPLSATEGYLQQYQPGPLPRVFQTTRIYDRHGTLLAERFDEGRRTWLPLARIAPDLIRATVATEDATFYQNSGIDPLRIVASFVRNAQAGEIVSGASTITMQLARNLFLGPEQRYDQTLDRKVLEAGLAQELTELYSKDELLEMYLNLLNYGNLAYGPEAAAQTYFGKSASDLTLAEASFLAGIPQAPAILDPYTNLAGVRERQRIVLDLMVRHGELSAAEADTIFAQEIAVRQPTPRPADLAPHFVNYVLTTINQQLGAGYLQRAGFQVFTTLDLPMQQLAQTLVQERVAALREPHDLSNGALVALKPGNNEILVMVGSADFNDPSIAGQVNVATQLRQPGSAIKPVLYATALNDNLVSPATVLWDVPITYTISAGNVYTPRNYDNQFHGPLTVRSALANSYNVPTINLLAGLGIERMLQSARAMGIQSWNQPAEYYGLSLTLGGGEVSLLDLTTAYHTLANEGRYLPPQAILRLTDSRGNSGLLSALPVPLAVLTPEAAFLITDILSDNEARTPAFGASSPLQLAYPAAVKTGTTSDFRDNWTIGYTRYLVAGVWAGNSDGRPMRNTSGVTGAAPIWHDFMQQVLDDPTFRTLLDVPAELDQWSFTPPETVIQLPDCPPGLTCRAGGEFFSQSWLELAGDQGPLADSVARVATAPVYVQTGDGQRLAGFCMVAGAAERTLLRLPTGFGLMPTGRGLGELLADLTDNFENSADLFSEVRNEVPNPLGATGSPVIGQAQLQAMAWSFAMGIPLNLGPCEVVAGVASQALRLSTVDQSGGATLLVDLAAAGVLETAAVAGGGAVELATFAGQVEQGLTLSGGRYLLAAPIVHDHNCPGAYIMGRVLDVTGAPMAGVTIKFRDEWGNQASAVSKSGGSDFGMFDFPIPSNSPHELYLWVVDPADNQISPTITIQHRQGEAADIPCHHLVFQGG